MISDTGGSWDLFTGPIPCHSTAAMIVAIDISARSSNWMLEHKLCFCKPVMLFKLGHSAYLYLVCDLCSLNHYKTMRTEMIADNHLFLILLILCKVILLCVHKHVVYKLNVVCALVTL